MSMSKPVRSGPALSAYTLRQREAPIGCTFFVLSSKSLGPSLPEEEEPDHQPDEDYHQEDGRQEEQDRGHGRTIASKSPGGLGRRLSLDSRGR